MICVPCELKLEQHHRFIQRVIQNQKKIQGNRPIIPLLEQHLRVRVTPVDGSDNNFNIEPVTSDSSVSSDDDEVTPANQENFMDTSSSSVTSSTSSSSSSNSSSYNEQAVEEEGFHEEVHLEQRIQESLNDDRQIILIDDEAIDAQRGGDNNEDD